MPTYIALLRGINVGGRNKLSMDALRAIHADLGHRDIVTYVQSGNVVFDADTPDAAAVASAVEGAVESGLGVDVSVVVRTAEEMAAVAAASPYADSGADVGRLGVMFLVDPPDPGAVDGIDRDRSRPDEFAVIGREIYLHLPNGFGRTKYTNAFFESQFGTVGTTRNWRTVGKLRELSDR